MTNFFLDYTPILLLLLLLPLASITRRKSFHRLQISPLFLVLNYTFPFPTPTGQSSDRITGLRILLHILLSNFLSHFTRPHFLLNCVVVQYILHRDHMYVSTDLINAVQYSLTLLFVFITHLIQRTHLM